ncbi:Gfo/Idh/MocA family oxidoreductase [Vibrio sp. CAU 1672]|uniref:Gfo/Idh/MocA family protein n=1 Tax=Vibrio sp. CAU 1672 TaxID=3032594 RepID=UPI0023DA8CE4|nr:Gfo/Idh/MocA family oxidoreductase [Vibrio sp. CAU 1672]MDF2152706.1 Gfo/Idh/MocA family oxidoreductase [Vibrio sp. CAU 1672]
MKIGIIGLGDIAQKAYLPAITQFPNLELVLCTRNTNALAALAQQYRVKETCQDYHQLPGLGVDAVMIHAATKVHFQIADYFLRQRIPVFVDKPLADSADEVERLYEISAQASQPLYVGFNRRHIPLYNQHMPGLQQGDIRDLKSLRWEKHRHNLPGDVRTFIFDDFIHPLDSINVTSKAELEDSYVISQFAGNQLARLDIQWQHGETLLHASMNRQFGITTERVQACYANQAVEFDSFVGGRLWHNNQEQTLSLKDWTPMLASKGFHSMLEDWFEVVNTGQLAHKTVERNIASHQLAEALCQRIEQNINR